MSVDTLPAEVEFEDTRAAQILRRIQDNELIDDMGDVFPEYHEALRQTLYIAAQSEVTVLTWAYTAYETAPDIGAKIAISATIQDEIGHAHQQGMLLERFGTSVEDITFNVDPVKVKTLMIMQFPVKNYIEFCMSQALLDRAGRITTKDIEENRSEERRVGKECVSTCRSRWSQYH